MSDFGHDDDFDQPGGDDQSGDDQRGDDQSGGDQGGHAQQASAVADQRQAPRISVVLNHSEERVLGSLIEKSFLTPDVYPMTTNGLVTACNQKTNRDPVVSFSAVDVDGALMAMRQRNLVRRVHTSGSRSTKHRQTLDEALALNDKQLVLMSVLLLRGPQTIGELRLRTERHDVGFEDLEAVESCLEGLSSRVDPLVTELARQPGQKETRWQHLIGDPDAQPPEPAVEAPAPPAENAALGGAGLGGAGLGVGEGALGERVESLESQVATLRRQLASLADKLGEPL